MKHYPVVHLAFAAMLLLLKFGGLVTWPWLWVTSPLWLPVAVFLAAVTLVLTVGILATVIDMAAGRK